MPRLPILKCWLRSWPIHVLVLAWIKYQMLPFWLCTSIGLQTQQSDSLCGLCICQQHDQGSHKCNSKNPWNCGGAAHRRRSRQMFGGAKDFCPNSPQLARKNSITKWPPKKLLMLFWAPFLLIFTGVFSDFQVFCEGFQRFCPDFHGFSPNQNFWGALAPPEPCPPYTSGAA